jgi:carboxymethylenebutenolidase
VEIRAADGHCFTAWRCDPIDRVRGGIVVLHAIWGLTRRMGEVCARFAEAGYIAIAPALYARLGSTLEYPYDRGVDGVQSYAALSAPQILTDVEAASADCDPTGTGAVAIGGFCTGGSWAWRAAAALTFRAQVNFYGSHVPQLLDLTPRCPTLMHYGDGDHIVAVAEIERIRQRHPSVQVYLYPGAGHAFENPDQTSFDPAAASLAWSRTIAFLDQQFAARAGPR